MNRKFVKKELLDRCLTVINQRVNDFVNRGEPVPGHVIQLAMEVREKISPRETEIRAGDHYVVDPCQKLW